jgi:hypothetical protein
VDPKKIESMQYWPRSKTLNILHGFLGLTGCYRNFFHNYGNIVAPLTSLLKKNDFAWTSVEDHAFQALKDVIFSTPILELLEFTKIFILECDASRKGIGVILMQNGRPLAFTRKQLAE